MTRASPRRAWSHGAMRESCAITSVNRKRATEWARVSRHPGLCRPYPSPGNPAAPRCAPDTPGPRPGSHDPSATSPERYRCGLVSCPRRTCRACGVPLGCHSSPIGPHIPPPGPPRHPRPRRTHRTRPGDVVLKNDRDRAAGRFRRPHPAGFPPPLVFDARPCGRLYSGVAETVAGSGVPSGLWDDDG